MAFDPDTYLSTDFDPDQYLAAANPLEEKLRQSLAPEKVGKGEAALRAISSIGTAGLGTRTFGLRNPSRMGGFNEYGMLGQRGEETGARSRLAKAEVERDQQAIKDRPVVSLLAGAPAALLAAPLAPARAAGLGGRLLQAMGLGAGYGAVGGVARSTDPGEIPANVAVGAGTGAVAGPLLQGAGELVGAGASAVSPLLRKLALEQGRKALTGNAGTIGVKKPLSEAAVEAAYSTGAVRPLSTVKGAAERLEGTREALGDRYGEIVDQLAAKGVEGPKVSGLALNLSDEARQMTQAGNPAPEMFRKLAAEIAAEPAAIQTGRLPLQTAEQIKRNLQNAARAEYVKEGPTSLAGSAKMDLASRLRQAVEDAVQAQKGMAPEEAAAFEPIKRQLSAIIEASNAANTAAARASRKSSIGLIPTIAAGAGYGSGGLPAAAALGAAAKAAQTMGPSTIGSLSRALANALQRAPGAQPQAAGAAASPELRTLLEVLLGKPGIRLAPVGAEENR